MQPTPTPTPRPDARIDYPPLAGQPCIFEWRIDHIVHFLFEIPTAAVLPRLPPGVYPVEPRPGVALLDVGYVRYAPGNGPDRAWPAFDEISVLLVVQPDLTLAMPTPKFSFFVMMINANLKEFIDLEPARLKLPRRYDPHLTATFDPARWQVEVAGIEGAPIMTLANTMHPPRYRREDYVGQYYSVEGGRLYHGVWQFECWACEHQRPGDPGALHSHAAFADLDVAPLGEVYMQLFTDPDRQAIQRFFAPVDRGPVAGGRS